MLSNVPPDMFDCGRFPVGTFNHLSSGILSIHLVPAPSNTLLPNFHLGIFIPRVPNRTTKNGISMMYILKVASRRSHLPVCSMPKHFADFFLNIFLPAT